MNRCQKAIETLTTLSKRLTWGFQAGERTQTKTASQSNCTRSCELRRQGYRHHFSTGRWTKPPAGSATELQHPLLSKSFLVPQLKWPSQLHVSYRGKLDVRYYSCFPEEKTEAQRSCLGSYSIQANIRIRTKTPRCIIWPTYCVSEKHPVRYYSLVRVTRIATRKLILCFQI